MEKVENSDRNISWTYRKSRQNILDEFFEKNRFRKSDMLWTLDYRIG